MGAGFRSLNVAPERRAGTCCSTRPPTSLTNRLDLSVWHPDFVALSCYKIFGWPTGVGCLLARRDPLAQLGRPWLSGGTSVAGFVQRQYYQSAPGAAHFEDGNVNYLNLPAVEIGLRLLDRIGIETIQTRVAALGAWLLDLLGALGHSDGSPAAVIYGPRKWEQPGGTIAFNFLHPDRSVVDERYVDRIASEHNISLRMGCSATLVRARSRSRAPARLCSAASSARDDPR